MKIKFVKSFNNNAALVCDTELKEWIVVGSGVSFGKKAGDLIDVKKIERYFVAQSDSKEINEQINIISSFQDKVLETTTLVTKLAQKTFNVVFNDFQYFSLADHLNFAIERSQEDMVMTIGATRWELETMYPLEYKAALEAKSLIEDRHKIVLPESETIFLTYHFVNAHCDKSNVNDTMKMTQIIQQTIDLIQRLLQIKLDTEDFQYTRFITHLRFFILKKMKDDSINEHALDPLLIQTLQLKYEKAYEIAKKVAVFYNHQEQWNLADDELLYLTLHIWRVTQIKK